MALQKLVESFAKDWNNNQLPLEKLKLNEKESENKILCEGKEYKIIEGYKVPVWKLDIENLNGRKYSKKLGEKVVKEKKVTIALKDHPEDDGSVDRIVAVGKNPVIDNGVLYAECYFVDEAFAKKVNKLVEHGAGIGLSSAGLGELDETGSVKEESFQLERYFDFVINPSFGVFLKKENEMQESIKINEAIDKYKIFVGTDILGKFKEYIKRNNIRGSSITNEEDWIIPLTEEQLVELVQWFLFVDKNKNSYIKNNMNKVIFDPRQGINKVFDVFPEEKKEDIAKEEIKKSKKGINELYKNMKNLTIEQKNFVISMNKFINEAKVISDLENKINRFNELLDYCKEEDGQGNLINEDFYFPFVSKIKENLKELDDEYNSLAQKGKETDSLRAQKSTLEKTLEEKDKEYQEIIEKNNDLYEKFDELKEYTNKMKEMFILVQEELKNYKESYIESEKLTEAVNYIEKLEKEVLSLREKNQKLIENNTILQNQIGETFEQTQKEKKELEQYLAEARAKAEQEKEKEKERLIQKEKEIKEKTVFFDSYKTEVYSLYEDWVKENPKFEKYKEEILSCRNAKEAQIKYLKLRDIVYEDILKMSNPVEIKIDPIEESKIKNNNTVLSIPKGWV